MNLNDLFTEEKVRLDPKCWTGKKIGNPKTKMKGGTRVNNCVPAESVEEDLTRRGFLKGMGVAAVAGAAGSSMAQNVNYAQYAAMAAKKAGDGITGSNWVALSGSAGSVRSYVSNNVQQLITAYCMDTDAYNIENVIEDANRQSLAAAENVGYTLGADRRTISVDKANAFVSTYRSVLMQKIREHTNATRQGSSAIATQSQRQSVQKPQNNDDPMGEPRQLKGMIEYYVLSKDNNLQDLEIIKQNLAEYIKITGKKDTVNSMYASINAGLNSLKSTNPERYNKIVGMYQESSTRRMAEFTKFLDILKNKPEFESVNQGVAEATGDEKFDTMMGQIQREPKYPDSQMPPTDVKDLYQWAVKNNKPYHKIFAEWANREGYKSVAPALQRAGDLDTEALDYWTPRVWKIYWGEVRGIDSEMPPEWSKKRVPDELRDYLETVFDAYDNIVFDWPTEYRQIGGQDNYAEGASMAEGKPKEKEADYGADYQDMVSRVKKLAGLGPLKTVYDPTKRVYRNVPTAVQPKK